MRPEERVNERYGDVTPANSSADAASMALRPDEGKPPGEAASLILNSRASSEGHGVTVKLVALTAVPPGRLAELTAV